MHSSDYIYEEKSTNNSVCEVKNCLWRFNIKILFGVTSMFVKPVHHFTQE